MKDIFLIFFFLFSFSSYSQTITVLDKSNSKPIPYATVQFIKDNTVIGGNYTNDDGLITYSSKLDINEVKITCIGYKTSVLDIKNVSKIILLESETITLNEVIIKNKTESDFENINFIDKKSKYTNGFGKGYEVCVFIENKEEDIKDIHSVLIKIIKENKVDITDDRFFRIHFYGKDIESELPGKEMLIDNMVYFIKPSVTGLIAFDISKYNIQLPLEGIFVSIEILGRLDTIQNDFMSRYDVISFDTNFTELKKQTFIRSIFNKYTWYNFSDKLKKMNRVKNNSKKQCNLMIGLKVYKE